MTTRTATEQTAQPLPRRQHIAASVVLSDPEPDYSKQDIVALSGCLQRTLEVEELLNLFAEKLTGAISYEHIQYDAETDLCRFARGQPAKYSCDYHLVLFQESLGSLKISRKKPFRMTEIQLLESFLTALVYPLRNALLYRRAVADARTDPVTGIANRAAFNETLEREIHLAHRHNRSLSLLMVDADHFKRVNDTYGHVVGDVVLRGLAQRLTNGIRCSDTAYRYGGEEFGIILNSTHEDGARVLAAKIRRRVEEACIRCDSLDLPVTVSIGVGSLQHGDTLTSLLERTDKALYLAKALGRNRVATQTEVAAHAADTKN